MTTVTTLSTEKTNAPEKTVEFMDLTAINELLEENIKLLDEKLEQFRNEFDHRFHGYSPEFFSDMLFVKNLKVKTHNL